MGSRQWPAPVVAVGAVSTGSVLWTAQGRHHLTVIVKATFGLRHDGPLAQLAAEPLVPQDRHHGSDPRQSLSAAGDLVPFRPRADVWLTGNACAPAGQPAEAVNVRLALYRGETALIDKTLTVYGERPPGATVQCFLEMPLLWELAVGNDENPVGIRVDSGAAGGSMLPCIVDPADEARPAGFGPIPGHWQRRGRQLTPEARQRLAAPVMQLPDVFDWSYFQAAPEDQQIPLLALQGGEWLVLEGLHPALPRVQTQLPTAAAEARVWTRDAGDSEGYPLTLVADTFALNTERQICSITWRGSFPLAGESQLETLYIAAGLPSPQAPIDWFSHRPSAAAAPAATQESVAEDQVCPADELGETVNLQRPPELGRLLQAAVQAQTGGESLGGAQISATGTAGKGIEVAPVAVGFEAAAGPRGEVRSPDATLVAGADDLLRAAEAQAGIDPTQVTTADDLLRAAEAQAGVDPTQVMDADELLRKMTDEETLADELLQTVADEATLVDPTQATAADDLLRAVEADAAPTQVTAADELLRAMQEKAPAAPGRAKGTDRGK